MYGFTEALRRKHDLPALGVGIVRDGRIIGLGMAGERMLGSDDWATLGDGFDVASCSKPVTATVAAILVEQGVLRWDLSIDEAFPELRGTIHPDYAQVTLEMLLRHQSGLDRWMSTNERWSDWPRGHANASATEQRRRFVEEVLQHPPRYPPDTDTYYCNDGYLVAGSMVEKISGKAWEEIVQSLLFEPLNLGTMRFGAPAKVWGHESGFLGRTRAIRPDSAEYGDPPFGSPAGFLSSSVSDLLRFVEFHIQGDTQGTALLGREAFAALHTPTKDQHFALGWEVEVRHDTDGKVLERSIYHGVYSGRFRTNIWFCPESRTGTVIVYNHGGENRAAAYADIFYALLGEFGLAGN